MAKAHDAAKTSNNRGGLAVCLRCVVTSLGMSLAKGMQHVHSLREVPMVGTCELRRSWGGVPLWDEALGWRCHRGTRHRLASQEDVLFGHPKDFYVLGTSS